MTPAEARTTIEQHCDVVPTSLTLLGQGSDSVAYLVDELWVFRFPLVDAARETLRKEISLLPGVRTALTAEVPRFEYVGGAPESPVFVGYRKLRGDALTNQEFEELDPARQERVLEQLATFLRELHAYPVEQARAAGVREELFNGGYSTQQRVLLDRIRPQLSAEEATRLEQAFTAYEDSEHCRTASTSFVHGDLKPAHVMIGTDGSVGIIDWGDANIGDPDFDFACLSIFYSGSFVERLLRHLPELDAAAVISKVEFFVALRSLQDAVLDAERYGRR
jgi:aminoglycoside 2''-phosphotransferase